MYHMLPRQHLSKNFRDLHIKSEKALYTPGAAFLNIMAPCPRGWRYNTPDIIDLCKAAVDTCFWPLFECYDGEKWVVNYIPKKKLPIEDFLRSQGRLPTFSNRKWTSHWRYPERNRQTLGKSSDKSQRIIMTYKTATEKLKGAYDLQWLKYLH